MDTTLHIYIYIGTLIISFTNDAVNHPDLATKPSAAIIHSSIRVTQVTGKKKLQDNIQTWVVCNPNLL